MSLIEKLGGYERAKHEFKMIEEMTPKFPDEVKTNNRLLLEYRREHNIFEVGDCVLRNDGFYNVLRITGIDNGCADLVRRVDGEPRWSRFKLVDIHHATPEEIEAGRRL